MVPPVNLQGTGRERGQPVESAHKPTGRFSDTNHRIRLRGRARTLKLLPTRDIVAAAGRVDRYYWEASNHHRIHTERATGTHTRSISINPARESEWKSGTFFNGECSKIARTLYRTASLSSSLFCGSFYPCMHAVRNHTK